MTCATQEKNDVQSIAHAKAHKVIEKYLEHLDCNIVDEPCGRFEFIYEDGDTLAFAGLDVSVQMPFPKTDITREEFEEYSASYLIAHPEFVNTRVRFDAISLCVLNGSCAYIRRIEGCCL